MRISGIAIGQWKQLCKKYKNVNDNQLVRKKIKRAYTLGKITHIYDKSHYVVRYHDLNLLAYENEILTIWRDKSRPAVEISETTKRLYSEYADD